MSDKVRYRDTDYLHLSVALRVRESKLLDMEAYDKLLEAKTPDDTVRLLADMGYAVPDGVTSAADYEKILTAELTSAYAEVLRSATGSARINPQLLEIFRLQYDFMNLKALIKAELLGISPDGMLFGTGILPTDEMIAAVRDRDEQKLGTFLYSALTDALKAFADDNDPQAVDLACDKAYFSCLKASAAESGFGFLEKYALLRTDIMNVSAYLRIKLINKPYAFFADRIYSEGNIPESVFAENYTKPFADFLSALSSTALASLSALAEDEKLSLSRLEQLTDGIIVDYIKTLRLIPFGAELVASYLLAKEAELKNTRIVIAGKLAGLPAQTVRERLRFGYV